LLSFSYHRLAINELLETIRWYKVEQKRPERAARFYASLERAVAFIRAHPEAAPLEHPIGVRAKRLDRFDYTVHYLVLGGRIRILAIGHQKQSPFYWIRRIHKP